MSISRLLYQNLVWRGAFYLSGFILNVLIARFLGAASSGQFYYLISILSFITLVASFSLESGFTYFSAGNKIGIQQLFSAALLWIFCTLLVVTGIIFFVSNIFETPLTGTQYLYGIIFTAGNLLITFLGSFFYAKQNFKTVSLAGVFINVCLIFLVLIFRTSGWLDEATFFLIYFGSFLLQGILLCLLFLQKFGFTRFQLPAGPQLRMLLKYCLISFSSNLVTFLIYRIDYWFVERYCSASQLGNYIQVSKIAQLFFIVPGVLAAVIFPVTASGRIEETNALIKILSRTILFLYGLACIILVCTGYWIFPFVFGQSFNQMYLPFVILIPGILSLSILYTLTAYYAGKGKVSVNLKASFYTLVIICLGDALLIPRGGIKAAAFVSSVGYAAYFLFVFTAFLKEYRAPAAGFFIFKVSDFHSLTRILFNRSDDK